MTVGFTGTKILEFTDGMTAEADFYDNAVTRFKVYNLEYQFIYNPETGALIDAIDTFGNHLANQTEIPAAPTPEAP